MKIVGCTTVERRMPVKHEDDTYVMCIRRANLDAMWGAALTAIPPQGHMPITDNYGMGLAVELLCISLTEKPKMKQDESHVQLYHKVAIDCCGKARQWGSSRDIKILMVYIIPFGRIN